MIIVLYGKDSYRLQKKLEEITEEYRKKHGSGLNLKFLDEKSSFEDLRDEERQVSMFKEKRLIVVKGCFSSSSLKKEIIGNPEKIISSENIVIFYEEGEVDRKDDLLSLLEKRDEVKIQEFIPFSKEKLFRWIKKEFKKNETEVEDEVVFSLAGFGGENLWRIKNEIEKLSLYSNSIKKEDADLLVKSEIETNIFKMIDALAFGEKEKAIFLLSDHLQKGDNPLYLLTMIEYQFRNLIAVRELMERDMNYEKMKKESGLHSFVFNKSYKQAQRFSYEELKKIYDLLFETDLKTKTGQIDPVTALYMIVFKT